MTSEDQKKLWKQEKEQMLSDKKKAGRVELKRYVSLSFGGPKKQEPASGSLKKSPGSSGNDNILRKMLGI
ncbi:MAG: hypothetical protein DKM50_03810 [Candidatus Margulisiibacteriota bacterium]|nr:MAG: hypothetical protein A2X43_01525 [Candidatus Margulisbacteria bacterium GWD2_39_127]OGI04533.1 MAG: hypothetical protein A2X42_10420 [Candidatus Margulisbacteria bacterium GWF2_38_17]OGI07112.1 MAG: hypothetical protein A2X41_12760 [Candidatus Margulisbacteria bacterium GWE2_39_32]PZM82262.1 MAG: hypothetical protein DKM50_03810 [Candidatus Margulisiibacteriota bacterium]HAR62992.1 hypothetical protein [Candidatus Margulisiibacteriota bacterium]